MLKKLLFTVLVFVVCTNSWAAEMQWFGGAPDRDWFNTANWGPAGGPIPTGVDKAKLNYVWANPGPVISATGAIANEIFISEDRDTGTIGEQSLTIAAGGELTANGQVILGYFGPDSRAGLPANEGRLTIDGGTATLATLGSSHLWVGFGGIGHLVVNSGLLEIKGNFGIGFNGGSGTVELNGGVLNTQQFNFNNASDYSFDIAGGEWIEKGFYVAEIEALVNAGKITGYGGNGEVVVTWDPVLEQTHVTAVIPEPITITLLGIGAFLIRRRS